MMSNQHANDAATTLDASLVSDRKQATHHAAGDEPGFFRRYRLPIVLGIIAVCLYAGSILYILYGRGQIA